MKEVQFDSNGIQTIINGLEKPINNTRKFFDILATMIDQDTQLTFRLLGARSGHAKWLGYNLGRGHILGGSTRTELGTWKLRYIKNPKRTREQLNEYKTANNLWYKRGYMKGYESDVRYSMNSVMLQNSGRFRQSFRILDINSNGLRYGTRMNPKIMSHGREVLFVTTQDLKRWKDEFVKFLSEGITF